MRDARKNAVLGAVVFALAFTGNASAQQQPPPVKDDALTQTARELFDKGSKAAAAGQWEQCRASYLAAWKINQHWQIAGNLALCESKLKRNTEAARHLAFFLRESPPDRRKDGQALFDEVRAKVAQVDVKVEVNDVEIVVDGQPHGRTPLSEPVFVDPGRRVFEAKAVGYDTTRKELEVTAGSTQDLALPMVKLPDNDLNPPVPTATATTTSAPPDVPPGKKSIVPPIVLGAVGVVGIGLGAGLLVAKGGKRDDAGDKKNEIETAGGNCNPITTGFETQCSEHADMLSSADTLGTAGIVSLVIGGTSLAAAGAYLLFWPPPASPRQAGAVSVRAVPVVGASTSGMLLKGTF